MNQTSPQESRTLDLEKLTPRQREVLRLIARGETNAAIAERLGISLAGAKWHVSEIISRLGVDSREEAADLWREHQRLGRRVARLGGVLVLPKAGWTTVSATASVAVVAAGVFVAIAMFSGDEPVSPGAVTTATASPGATQVAPDSRQPDDDIWPQPIVIGRDAEAVVHSGRELDALLEECVGDLVRVELWFEKLDGLGSPVSDELAGWIEVVLDPSDARGLVIPMSQSPRGMPERGSAVAIGECLAPSKTYLAEYALGYPDDSLSGAATGAIVFPGDGLDYRSGAGPRNMTFREYLGSITVTVDGVVCSTHDLRGQGDFKLLVGRPGEPAECSKPGARIVLYEELGRRLLSEFRLEPGVTWTIFSVGPDPGESVADLGSIVMYPDSAYGECPDVPQMFSGDPFCVKFSETFIMALGWRLVVDFPGTGERFEYFLPPETTSFRPPHPDDLYRPLKICEHGGTVMVESFLVTAQRELPGSSSAATLECAALP